MDGVFRCRVPLELTTGLHSYAVIMRWPYARGASCCFMTCYGATEFHGVVIDGCGNYLYRFFLLFRLNGGGLFYRGRLPVGKSEQSIAERSAAILQP